MTIHTRCRCLWRGTTALSVAGVALLVISACGSSGGGSQKSTAAGPGSTASSACVTAANDYLKPYLDLPTKLTGFEPLKSKPKPGGTLDFIYNSQIPDDIVSANAIDQVIGSIGWTIKKVAFDGTVADLVAKWDEAISEKPTVIAGSGWGVSVLGKQFDAAKQAGIVVSISSITDDPKDYPGYASLTNGPSTDKIDGEINAALVLRQSGCNARVAVFNLAYPILRIQTDAFKAFLTSHCPSCKVTYTEIQASDLGTPNATKRIISTLQADTSINYVYSVLGNIADGLHAAMRQADITNVKTFGWQPDAQSLQGLKDGTDQWWVGNGDGINGLAVMDGALRAIDTQKAAVAPTQPIAIYTPENSKDLRAFGQGAPAYPVDYQAQFKALWHAN